MALAVRKPLCLGMANFACSMASSHRTKTSPSWQLATSHICHATERSMYWSLRCCRYRVTAPSFSANGTLLSWSWLFSCSQTSQTVNLSGRNQAARSIHQPTNFTSSFAKSKKLAKQLCFVAKAQHVFPVVLIDPDKCAEPDIGQLPQGNHKMFALSMGRYLTNMVDVQVHDGKCNSKCI